ncbi:MAG: hypothetical protein ACK4Z5_04090 [Brevundimonas sp.]
MNRALAFGARATRSAMLFSVAAGIAGIVIAVGCAVEADLRPEPLVWGLLVLFAFDLTGGVAANADPSNWAVSPQPSWRKLAFAVIHVHPIVLAALMAPDHLVWAGALWLATIVTVAFAWVVPTDLRRPFLLTVAAVILADHAAAAPEGLEWLAPVYVLKLVAAYAWRISGPATPASSAPGT